MPKNKMKTHSGSKKVFKKRPGGTIKMTRAGTLHNTGKQAQSKMRAKKKGSMLSKGDFTRLKDIIK